MLKFLQKSKQKQVKPQDVQITIRTIPISPPMDEDLYKALTNGETLARDKALSIPAVAAAVDFISGAIASMPIKLYKVTDGSREEQTDDIRMKLLNGDTGDLLDAYQIKKAMIMDYFLDKGGYCFVQKKKNKVISLKYVPSEYMAFSIINTDPLNKVYSVFVYDNEYKPFEFLKLIRNTKNGVTGFSVINEITAALKAYLATVEYQSSALSKGGISPGYLQMTGVSSFNEEQMETLREKFKNVLDEGKVPALNKGIEYKESGMSNTELQLNECKKTLDEEINDIFHIKADFYDTYKYAIYPIIKAFETQLNSVMLLEKEKKNMFFEFDTKEIVRAPLEQRYRAYKLAKEAGFLTINEIREDDNREPKQGLDVLNVGLGAVLYDIDTGKYFIPNTGELGNLTDESIKNLIEDKEIDTEFEEDGNSSV